MPPAQLRAAYRTCRAIAKREAKNFYYSFLALPPHKRDAMCAVYAFMRHADDLTDDESKSRDARRTELSAWTAEWKAALEDGGTADPVLVALADTSERFRIPVSLLEQLVQGTAMDLAEGAAPVPSQSGAQALATYRSFADLYRYCYYVASVVGLVCIRIFGYSDSRAEKFAEETGIAFQLTNILRDVREDAERGRLYLPLDELARFGVSPEEITSIAQRGAPPTEPMRALLASIAGRAHAYYAAAAALLPLIDRDSRPALWVLVSIYARLLRRIERQRFNVFSARIRVPTWQKIALLLGGTLRTWASRLFRPFSR